MHDYVHKSVESLQVAEASIYASAESMLHESSKIQTHELRKSDNDQTSTPQVFRDLMFFSTTSNQSIRKAVIHRISHHGTFLANMGTCSNLLRLRKDRHRRMPSCRPYCTVQVRSTWRRNWHRDSAIFNDLYRGGV